MRAAGFVVVVTLTCVLAWDALRAASHSRLDAALFPHPKAVRVKTSETTREQLPFDHTHDSLRAQGVGPPPTPEPRERPLTRDSQGTHVNTAACYDHVTHWRVANCLEDQRWLVPWALKRPNTSWFMIDVGANKGYVIAGWIQILSALEYHSHGPQQLGVGIFSTFKNITQGFNSLCGGCCECLDVIDQRALRAAKAQSLKIVAFEPSVANAAWLQSFFASSNHTQIVHAAVSDNPGTAYFPNNRFGVEIGKVLSVAAPGYVPVNIASLDSFFAASPPVFVDVLSTDAEGFDQDVARGAKSLIATGRVGVYQFEMYRAEDYHAVFERLDGFGYTCFFPVVVRRKIKGWRSRHSPRVPMYIQITSPCWKEVYNRTIGWSNAVCYNRRVRELHDVFEVLKKNRAPKEVGNCPGKAKQRRAVRWFLQRHVLNQSTAVATTLDDVNESGDAGDSPSEDHGSGR